MVIPAKDIYHSAVKFALIKDGWNIITEDYTLEYEAERYMWISQEKNRLQ